MEQGKKKQRSQRKGLGFIIAVVVFPVLLVVFGIISHIHLSYYNDFAHSTSDADNVIKVVGKTRQETPEAWLSQVKDGEETEGVIYSVDVCNTGNTPIVKWQARINFHEDCYLNSGWNGRAEIHQNALADEKVDTLALGEIGKKETNLEFVYAGDACLIKLYAGDYMIYYPSVEAKEMEIAQDGDIKGLGLIMYNEPGNYIDLNDVEVSYYKHLNFEDTFAYIAFIVLTVVGVICLAALAVGNYISNKRLRQEVIDLTIKAKDEAIAANKEKTLFLSNMSHDIRTPMNAVIGFTRMAINNIDNPDKVKECLTRIDSASEHLLALVNEVLDISHIESGRVEIRTIPVDWNVALRNFKNMFQAQAESKHMRLSIDTVNLEHPYVEMDLERFQRIIINLVANSIKYTDPNGRIVVLVEERASHQSGYANYIISVEDNGHGMDKDFLPHVFDSFSRESTEANVEIEGNGLGLAITKGTIELMGGSISVNSVLGAGTTFTIELPLKITEKPSVEKRARRVTLEDYKDIPKKYKNVLIADDNEINRELAMEILKGLNFNISFAINGLEAVNAIKNNPSGTYDVVLMDIRMPIMDGYEATQKIRGLEDIKKRNIPIFAVTADAFESDKLRAEEVGMNGYVRKPIELDEFIRVLVEL